MHGVLGCEQGRSRRGAQRRSIVLVEYQSVVGEGVYVGRGDLVATMETNVVPTLQTFLHLYKHNLL